MRMSPALAAGVFLVLTSVVARADEPVLVTATATSTLAPQGKHSYEAWQPLVPNDPGSWCEGKPDEGIGEELVLAFGSPTKVDEIDLIAGVDKSPALFAANNQPTAIDIITDDGRTITAAPSADRGFVEAAIGGAPTKTLKLRIAKVKRGRMNDTCISEITIDAAKRPVLIGVTAQQYAQLGPALDGMWKAINGCDDAAAKQYIRYPLPVETTGNNDHMVTKKLADAAAFVRACKKGNLPTYNEMTLDMKLEIDGMAALTLRDDTLAWRLALVDGAWKLVFLEDDTP